jgi:hypothetical protein
MSDNRTNRSGFFIPTTFMVSVAIVLCLVLAIIFTGFLQNRLVWAGGNAKQTPLQGEKLLAGRTPVSSDIYWDVTLTDGRTHRFFCTGREDSGIRDCYMSQNDDYVADLKDIGGTGVLNVPAGYSFHVNSITGNVMIGGVMVSNGNPVKDGAGLTEFSGPMSVVITWTGPDPSASAFALLTPNGADAAGGNGNSSMGWTITTNNGKQYFIPCEAAGCWMTQGTDDSIVRELAQYGGTAILVVPAGYTTEVDSSAGEAFIGGNLAMRIGNRIAKTDGTVRLNGPVTITLRWEAGNDSAGGMAHLFQQ